MKFLYGLVAVVLVSYPVFVLAAPASAPAPKSSESPTKTSPALSLKMQKLDKVLSKILVDISSDERFNDKKNYKTFDKNVNEFAGLAHNVAKYPMGATDQDVTLQVMGADFDAEAVYAKKSLTAGHREYARIILNSMVGYCIACHTRTGSGPQFTNRVIDPALNSLTPLAKGNYFVATRNFDQALLEYKKVSSDKEKASKEPFEYERALRAGLSVAVRVKKDPELALKLVENVIDNPKAAYYLRALAEDWKKSLLDWKAEKPKESSTDPMKLLDEAKRLVAKAKGTQEYPADRSADILYLRASGVIHELLGLAPKGLMLSNAFYLAGLTYDVINNFGIKDYSEFYYRSCIRNSPHTPISADCYRRYEESVYLGYSGSGGTYIPRDVRSGMDALEVLSFSKSVLPAPKPMQ